jgi:hypothetical protein
LKLSPPSHEAATFSSEFAGAVRTGLEGIVGDTGTQAVMFHTKMAGARLDPVQVHERLVALLGDQATLRIERAIILDLTTRVGLPLVAFKADGSFDFVAMVHAVENKFAP